MLNLIGNFSRPKHDIDMIREWVFQKWNMVECFEFVVLSNGFFLIKLCLGGDLQNILYGELYMFDQWNKFLKKWELEFEHNTQSITSIPFWIHLPILSLQYWHDEMLL